MKLVEFENEGKNSGCWVIRGEGKEEDKVIVRSNGTATYIAKDIPYAAWKLGLLEDPFNYKKYQKSQNTSRILWQTTLVDSDDPKQNFSGDKVITVIDSRQARLQKIITTLMAKFKSTSDAYVHMGYESVTLSPETARTLGLNTEGKQAQMSGRKGLYVNADSVYDLLKKKTIEETNKRHPEMSESEIQNIAHQISVGTLRYEMIKQDLDKIIAFDLTKSLSLEGDTAPYIQYTHARAVRIIEKSGKVPSIDVDFSLLQNPNELNLVRLIGLFDRQVRDAAKNLSPKVIARYCHDLAVAFNSFYEHVKVLDIGDEHLENTRLCLVNSFKLTVERSLDLLGITAQTNEIIQNHAYKNVLGK
jgi:arginyl-tRNA synthetase